MLVNCGIDAGTFSELVFYQEVLIRLCNRLSLDITKADDKIDRWFGDIDNAQVVDRVKRLKSLANTVKIDVTQAPLSERKGTRLGSAGRAGARQVHSVGTAMQDLQAATAAGKKGFRYKLNSALIKKDVTNAGNSHELWGQSCFANFAHELSHAFLGTHDVRRNGVNLYGPGPHLQWVQAGGPPAVDRYSNTGAYTPIDCARCWGFFLEDAASETERKRIANVVSSARGASMWNKPPLPAASNVIQ